MAEIVAEMLCFPTSVALDANGRLWVAESGLPFDGAPPGGRVVRIGDGGTREVVCEGLRAPVTGLTFHQDAFYVSEGGSPGRISRVTLDGERRDVIDGLPGLGNYHTNMTVVGPDKKLYFAQGSMTNSGVASEDTYDLGGHDRHLVNHDIPGVDVVLIGQSFETSIHSQTGSREMVHTGAFLPFGQAALVGQQIPGRLPCTSAVMRCDLDGAGLELVAWGLRSAFGMLFLPDGRLLATDQGADDRGIRPIGNAPDALFEVVAGSWYGFPDFVAGVPVTDDRFVPSRGPRPEMLLANHASMPPLAQPRMTFPVNASATKMALIPQNAPRWASQILVCLFGDERPVTGPAGHRAGRAIGRIDPVDWSLHDLHVGPLHRPIDVCVDPSGEYAYVLDFGEFEMSQRGVSAKAWSGALFRVPLGTSNLA